MSRQSAVSVADKVVDILYACRLIGMEVPSMIEGKSSFKLFCPFGDVWHSDFGREKAFRIYPDSNSAWCFACAARYNPVSLVVTATDRDPEDVAIELLDAVGYKPATLAQHWQQVQHKERPPDTRMLNLALRTYCERSTKNWQDRQFQGDIKETLDRCLTLLDKVSSEKAANEWLDSCKLIMYRVLSRETE